MSDDTAEVNTADDQVEILLVDDRAADLSALQQVLSRPDYSLVTASSGTDALRRVLDRDFAVILLDVMMPDMDGLEVARIIKERKRSKFTPIIFLTAAGADGSSIHKGYSVGAVDYLGKPIDADLVRAKVAIFVDLYRKDRRIREQAEALREADRRELAEVRSLGERRYRNLAEAIPHIVWTADADGRVTYFNKRWSEYTGQPLSLAKGAGWTTAVHVDDAAVHARRWRAALDEPSVLELECRLRDRNGNYRWHIYRAVPERGKGGMVLGWLGTFSDFDDRKRALDAAEAAVQTRDDFLSIASHELRTPLSTLHLRLETIESELSAKDPAWSRKLGSARRQTNRLIRLVDSLLDVSRISHGSLVMSRERFDLGEAVKDVVDRFAEVALAGGSAVSVEVESTSVGSWDRMRVEQIVQNLLSNALKYAPRSPIEVTVQGVDGVATVAVIDHGPGIAPKDRARIFDRFERAVPVREAGGLGLGLYIARQIARAHGGSLDFMETPGGGSTFLVALPLHVTTPAVASSPPNPVSPTSVDRTGLDART